MSTVKKESSIDVVGVIQISCRPMGLGKKGVFYSHQFATTNGLGAKTFAVTSGSTPRGMSLDQSTGIMSGTPKNPGTYVFSVGVSDRSGTAACSCSLRIAPGG